ncbi:hypothetical protein GGX14DRAFT_619396 [Mycena pura]|uniref:AAA-ATPase-like domain-containing protein n=1 Tax=Mycena pura TaxID=153505 RepID=A0AAD6VKZ0_9AGAR|nr:hypothetical protein GGX14DRAFT_619396 [Mycena pura]
MSDTAPHGSIRISCVLLDDRQSHRSPDKSRPLTSLNVDLPTAVIKGLQVSKFLRIAQNAHPVCDLCYQSYPILVKSAHLINTGCPLPASDIILNLQDSGNSKFMPSHLPLSTYIGDDGIDAWKVTIILECTFDLSKRLPIELRSILKLPTYDLSQFDRDLRNYYQLEMVLIYETSSEESLKLESKRLLDVSNDDSDLSTLSTGSHQSKRSFLESDNDEHGSEVHKKRVKSHPSSPAFELPAPGTRLPEGTDTFVEFLNRPSTAYVDKTHCILSLPDRYRYLLLRPPRFGKTTFLSTLQDYYDIHGARTFTDRFGSLAVVTDAPENPPLHSQHLCLAFDLQDMTVEFTAEEIISRLTGSICYTLNLFLRKYATELQLSHSEHPFLYENVHNFKNIFELVRASGHTMFVIVDNFDTPFQTQRPIDRWVRERAGTKGISNFLDSCFWAPLLTGSDVIRKLVVAGVLLPKHSMLRHLQLDIAQNFQVSCGFTEREALDFAFSVLNETVDVAELKCLCGGYVFPSQEASRDLPELLLHPQRLIDWIGRRIPSHRNNARFCLSESQLLSDIFEAIAKESGVAGAVSVSDLIGLLATGTVEVDCEVDALVDYDVNAPKWTALYYAGALTPDDLQAGTFRIPNDASFLDAWSNYCERDLPERFQTLFSSILRDQLQRGLARQREPNLRGIFELVMRNEHLICLRERVNPIILLPEDETRFQIPAYQTGKVMTVELRTLTLNGMWRGAHPNDDDRRPTSEELQQLHHELIKADDADLLARSYRAWSRTLNAMETVLVSSFFDLEPEIPQFLAVGGARVLLRQPPKAVEEQKDQEDDLFHYEDPLALCQWYWEVN